ncbi:MAG: FHA domain-containing protein [Alphaproteobacteria bacterium]|nr:FHA domain-containing protein [Alphaproteobacteria bacterium]
MKTLIVGRSSHADIVVADGSVARRHMEIVVTRDGRYYVTDCGTETGTWRVVGMQDDKEVWEETRQSFVHPDQPLRLGSFQCTLNSLFAKLSPITVEEGGGSGGYRDEAGKATPRPRGPVARDPRTGEIVRRRL